VATFREVSTGRKHVLEPEHVIGRARTSALWLDHRNVSARHAVIRFGSGRWELRDLGSRNGTFLNGSIINPRQGYVIGTGTKVASRHGNTSQRR
jgi:pSer/pThr/pTyr-binding forkhead associated (FHA) protein